MLDGPQVSFLLFPQARMIYRRTGGRGLVVEYQDPVVAPSIREHACGMWKDYGNADQKVVRIGLFSS